MLSLHRKNSLLRVLACAASLIISVLAPAAVADAQDAYQNPLAGDNYYTGRTDMGVDFCLHKGEPIRAIGNGVVVGIMRNWYAGQPFIWYQLTDGPFAGRYVYVAEQIWHLAHVGQVLTAGEPVARYAPGGTCIETGWGTASGWTLAQSTTGYSEGQRTVAGVGFAHFLISLGVQGPFELVPSAATARAKHTRHKKHHPTPHPVAPPTVTPPAAQPPITVGISPTS